MFGLYSGRNTSIYFLINKSALARVMCVDFLGFLTLSQHYKQSQMQLQLQACKYLPSKTVLLQLMNLGEAVTSFLVRATSCATFVR